MIISGGYLDFDIKPEENFKLGRIQMDISNDMDHDWNIDVRKAFASPPDRLRSDLLRIAKATRNEAVKIYRARTGRPKVARSVRPFETTATAVSSCIFSFGASPRRSGTKRRRSSTVVILSSSRGRGRSRSRSSGD